MMRLIEKGLMFGNLFEVSSSALVDRYNRALKHLTGKTTALKAVLGLARFDGELTDAMLCAPALGVAGIGELWGLARRTPPLVKRAPLRAAAKQPGPPTVAAARAAVRAGSSTAGSGGWWPWMDSAESDARRAAEDNASPRADRSAAGKGKSAAQPKVRSLFFVRTSFFYIFVCSFFFFSVVCLREAAPRRGARAEHRLRRPLLAE